MFGAVLILLTLSCALSTAGNAIAYGDMKRQQKETLISDARLLSGRS